MKIPPDISIQLSGPKFVIIFALIEKNVPKMPISRPFLAQTFPALYPDRLREPDRGAYSAPGKRSG
jgi:hypothetical protein